MRTAIEALFDAMINEGRFSASSGNVESPTGHFAYVTIASAEARELLDDYDDVTNVDGIPETDEIVGSFVVITDERGFIHIREFPDDAAARAAFDALDAEYTEWENQA